MAIPPQFQKADAARAKKKKKHAPTHETGSQFNPYAAGAKHYGGGRQAPNVGKGGAQSKAGYTRRDALQAMLKKRKGG